MTCERCGAEQAMCRTREGKRVCETCLCETLQERLDRAEVERDEARMERDAIARLLEARQAKARWMREGAEAMREAAAQACLSASDAAAVVALPLPGNNEAARLRHQRDYHVRAYEEHMARCNEEGERLQTIADEAFGPFPEQTAEENMTAIERGIFGLRQRIGQLEAEKEAFADVAAEGDVEELLGDIWHAARGEFAAAEVWGRHRRTAQALHDAWQSERQQRQQAEQDAERWHRLFDEGATTTTTIAAERDRLREE